MDADVQTVEARPLSSHAARIGQYFIIL